MRIFEIIGGVILKYLAYIGEITLLTAGAVKEIPKKIRPSQILGQMNHLGVNSFPIVSLTLLFTGMVLTLQTASEFIRFGAQTAIGGVVAIAIGRELGPVLVAVVFAGRVGSAMTAEISTMKVTEQIDALKVMGVNPLGYLLVPRMLACMVMLPILTALGDFIGVLGGYIVAVYYSGVTHYIYISSIDSFMGMWDLIGGLIKSIFFGAEIAILGSYYGMTAPEGAEGVGKATTWSVVAAIFFIFFTNVLLSWILF